MNERPSPPRLTASARIVLPDPHAMLARLCDHLTDHLLLERFDGGASFSCEFGSGRAEASGEALTFTAESLDDTGLSFLKLILAEHVLAFSGADTPLIRWRGDAKAGQPLPYFREMQVRSVGNVTPRMRRVVLGGTDLGRFATGGMHVRLLFPPEGGGPPQWPVMGEDGRPQWPEESAKPVARIYTIRHIDTDRGEVTVDMVLHGDPDGHAHGEHGPGAHFAQHAQPGDVVGMTGPGGGSIGEAQRYIMLGDETALPAIARLLEQMPASAEVSAFVEVADAAEVQSLTSASRLALHWLSRDGAPAGSDAPLERAVRSHPWLRDGGDAPLVWAGCEHAQARAIRRFLKKEMALAREKCHSVTYWRKGTADDEHED